LINSIYYDYSKNCNRLRLTITITVCLAGSMIKVMTPLQI